MPGACDLPICRDCRSQSRPALREWERESLSSTDFKSLSRLPLRPTRKNLPSQLASSCEGRRLSGRLYLSLRRTRACASPRSSRTILSFSPITRGRGKSSPQSMEAKPIFVAAEASTPASLQRSWRARLSCDAQEVPDTAIEARSSAISIASRVVVKRRDPVCFQTESSHLNAAKRVRSPSLTD
jgi:hypothetical protein